MDENEDEDEDDGENELAQEEDATLLSRESCMCLRSDAPAKVGTTVQGYGVQGYKYTASFILSISILLLLQSIDM